MEKKELKIHKILSFEKTRHVFPMILLCGLVVLAGCSFFGLQSATNNTKSATASTSSKPSPNTSVKNVVSNNQDRQDRQSSSSGQTTQRTPMFRINQNEFCVNNIRNIDPQPPLCFPCYSPKQGGCKATIDALVENAISNYILMTPPSPSASNVPVSPTTSLPDALSKKTPKTYPHYSR